MRLWSTTLWCLTIYFGAVISLEIVRTRRVEIDTSELSTVASQGGASGTTRPAYTASKPPATAEQVHQLRDVSGSFYDRRPNELLAAATRRPFSDHRVEIAIEERCCGLGHRLTRLTKAYVQAVRRNHRIVVFWGVCTRNTSNLFDVLFDDGTKPGVVYPANYDGGFLRAGQAHEIDLFTGEVR